MTTIGENVYFNDLDIIKIILLKSTTTLSTVQ